MPNVNRQQQYENSCGAACLLCAAYELGVTTTPVVANYSMWGQVKALDPTKDECEKRLYQMTSLFGTRTNNADL